MAPYHILFCDSHTGYNGVRFASLSIATEVNKIINRNVYTCYVDRYIPVVVCGSAVTNTSFKRGYSNTAGSHTQIPTALKCITELA